MTLRVGSVASRVEFRVPAPTSIPRGGDSFRDMVARPPPSARDEPRAGASAVPTPPPGPPVSPGIRALSEAGRDLIQRVARGEHAVENIVRQALSGRAFTPADLLALQARTYRYAQELELVSKIVDRGTSGVRTILQQNG